MRRRISVSSVSWIGSKVTLASLVLFLFGVVSTVSAQQTWDPAHTGTGSDGSGNWDLTSTLWSNGSLDQLWANTPTSVAVFGVGGTAGTVTVTGSGITAGGLTFNSGTTGNYTIGGSSITLGAAAVPIVVNTGASPTINSVLTGTNVGFVLSGGGTLTLGGANTYTGSTVLDGGTLAYAVDNTGVQNLTFGATASSTNSSTLDLTNANVTATGLTVQTVGSTTQAIIIGANKTLNIAGNVVVGVGNATPTTLSVTGGGKLQTGGTGATFIVMPNNSGSTGNSATVDLSGLNEFSFTGTELGVGGRNTSGTGNRSTGTLRLANTKNTITAATITIGSGSNSNAGGTSTIDLGAGINLLNADTINVSGFKNSGLLTWQATTATGSLTIRNQAGTGRATINIGQNLNASTTGTNTGTASLSGGATAVHSVDIMASTLTIGNRNQGGNGGVNGNLSFDLGTIDTTTLNMAGRSSSTAGTSTAMLTVGTDNTSTGTLIVGAGGFTLASNSATGGGANGTLDILGGLVQTGSNINIGLTTGPASGTIKLEGGTLDMQTHSIGVTGQAVAMTMPTGGQTSTLKNLGGGGINNAGLTMDGGGTLILSGNNSYTGVTNVNSGTLQFGSATPAVSSQINLNGGALAFTPGFSPFQIGGLTGSGGATLNDTSSGAVNLQIGAVGGSYSGVLSGTGGLVMAGTNGTTTQTLTGVNTYSGNTTINSGTLALSTAGQLYSGVGSPGTTSIAGGTLGGGTGTGIISGPVQLSSGKIAPDPGGTLTMNSLTTTGGTLSFVINGSSIGLMNVLGTATLGNSTQFSFGVTGAQAISGTYELLSAGTLSNSIPIPQTYSVVGATFKTKIIGGNQIWVDVLAPSNLIWIGSSGGGIWDVQTTKNWNNLTTPLNPDFYRQFDNTTFDDTGVATTVTLNTQVTPSTVVFSNSTKSYTVQGTGGIGGTGTLTVSGTGAGTVTLKTANSYTGNTTVSSGTLILGSGGSVSSPNMNVTGGALNINAGGSSSSANVNANGGAVTIANSGALTAAGVSVVVGSNPGSVLTVAVGGSIPTTANLTNNGTVNFNATQSIATLNGTSATAALNQTGALNVSGGGSYAGSIANGTSAGSLNISGGTLLLAGPSSTYSGGTTIASGGTLQVGSASDTGPLTQPLGTGIVTTSGTLNVASSQGVTIANAITGPGPVQQNGAGTTTLSGNNSYQGGTNAYNGTLVQNSDTALGPATNAIVLGAPGYTGTVGTNKVSTTSGSLTLNFNLTASSFSNTSASTAASPPVNTLTINQGLLMTINGPFTVGPPDNTNSTSVIRDTLTVTGGGQLVVNGNFTVAQPSNNGGGKNITTADLSGLNSVTVNNPTGTFLVGNGANTQGQLLLANTTVGANAPVNSVNVSEIDVGNTQGGNDPNTSRMQLGSGPNTLNANTINIGLGKTGGIIQFQSATDGSVTIAGTGGGSAVANITLGDANGGTYGTGRLAQLLLAGHSATVQAGAVIIGESTGNSGGGPNSTVTFDTGTFNAQSVTLAANTGGTSTVVTQGTLTIGGPTPGSAATGVLNVTNQFWLANRTNTTAAAGASTGSFIINGGTANIGTDILDASTTTSTAGANTTTLTLDGGTLNMSGRNIGSAAAPITNINLNSGNLNNPGIVAGKTITLQSAINISGAPTYVIANGGSLTSNLPTLTLASGGGLEGGGVSPATVAGDVVASNGSHVAPGSSGVASTLQLSGNLSLNSGSTAQFKLSGNAGSGNDQITVAASMTLGGTVNIKLGSLGNGPQFGNNYTLFTYGGTLTGDQTNFNVIGLVGTRGTYTIVPTATTPNSIQLHVGGAPALALTWIGNVNNNWDLIGAANWHDPGAAPQQFFNQDSVTFDDTSTNLNDVQLVGQLLPSSITVNASRNYKFAGVGSIANGSLTKSGSGMLIIANNNTYADNTDIQTGTLQIGDGGTIGSIGAGTISNAATLSFKRSDATTASNAISGAGVVRQDGAGTLTLSGNSTFSGGLVVNAGAVRLTSVTGAGTGAITVNPGATLVYDTVATNSLTLAGGIVGTSVALNPITADVTAAPATTSTIYLADPQNLPTVAGTDVNEFNITGTLHGSGNITVLSNGQDVSPDAGNGFRLRGTGTSDFSGTITLGNTVKGELQITDTALLSPAGTGKIVMTAGTLVPGTLNGTFSELNLRNNRASGNATFGNNLEIAGSGIAVINALSTASPETSTMGSLLIGAGQTLAVGKNAAGVNTVAFQNVTLNGTATFAPRLATLGFTGSANLILGSISENVPGSGITMAGQSTLFINGASTYTGPTTVSSGTLQLAAPDVLPNASKLVLSGGRFGTAGNNETVNTLVVTAPSAIDLGAGASVLHFADSHLESWQGPVTIANWSGNLITGVGTDQVFFGSSNTGLSGPQVSSIHFNGFNGTTLLNTGELIPVSVSNFHLGDWNADGTVNSADIPVMLHAMTDLNAYASATSTLHSAYPFALTNDDLLNIGDVNLSGSVSNGDIQAELDLVTSLGGGSLSAVPEPASFVLLSCGGLALALTWRRRLASRS